ncbi:NAD(P)-dependent oxidoreductase [Deltaproteobacteria bacterium]|nr:NAD(P)-dependent oxidoreductase [Deltaproteobacteria bacterium]
MKKTRILILGGATGLLGQALSMVARANGYDVIRVGRKDFNPLEEKTLADFIDKHEPDIICNTIGYTQVDKAEEETQAAVLLNERFPASLGRILRERPSVQLVHFSTDYVFNGHKKAAYTETDEPNPLNVYGRSKLAGETALLALQLKKLCIIRTAWLFGPGKRNFVTAILDLCRQNKPLNVVHDQTGSPTYTPDLALYTLKLLETGATGIFHIANSGQSSWCELASETIRLAMLECPIVPILSKDYPQKATRPAFSALDNGLFSKTCDFIPRSWIQALADYVYAITDQQSVD